ncbi:MAG: hypothetical protein R2941_08625 [Desulfobacterales bacterium]
MLVIHPVRKGKYILIPDHEFSALIQKLCLTKSVEIIEEETEIYETEEDRRAYAEGIRDLKCGNVSDFDMLKQAWLRGEPADV